MGGVFRTGRRKRLDLNPRLQTTINLIGFAESTKGFTLQTGPTWTFHARTGPTDVERFWVMQEGGGHVDARSEVAPSGRSVRLSCPCSGGQTCPCIGDHSLLFKGNKQSPEIHSKSVVFEPWQ